MYKYANKIIDLSFFMTQKLQNMKLLLQNCNNRRPKIKKKSQYVSWKPRSLLRIKNFLLTQDIHRM